MRQIVLDTETTGLEPKEGHRIIEIGCIELINRKYTGNNFHQYFNPQREVEAGALKVHGITNAFLRNKPIFEESYESFREYVDGAELIIHNAPFDVGFLNHEFKLINRLHKNIETKCTIFDTLVYAREKHPGQRNSLDALCKRYQVSNKHRKLHGALLDAKILAEVYLIMTGGQESLFSEGDDKYQINANVTSSASEACEKIVLEKFDLPTVMASKAELEAHENYFENNNA